MKCGRMHLAVSYFVPFHSLLPSLRAIVKQISWFLPRDFAIRPRRCGGASPRLPRAFFALLPLLPLPFTKWQTRMPKAAHMPSRTRRPAACIFARILRTAAGTGPGQSIMGMDPRSPPPPVLSEMGEERSQSPPGGKDLFWQPPLFSGHLAEGDECMRSLPRPTNQEGGYQHDGHSLCFHPQKEGREKEPPSALSFFLWLPVFDGDQICMKLPPETTALCLPPWEGGGGWVVSSLPSLHVLATGGGEGGGTLSVPREEREGERGHGEAFRK